MKNKNSKKFLSIEKIQVTRLSNLSGIKGGFNTDQLPPEAMTSKKCEDLFPNDSVSLITDPVDTGTSTTP